MTYWTTLGFKIKSYTYTYKIKIKTGRKKERHQLLDGGEGKSVQGSKIQ